MVHGSAGVQSLQGDHGLHSGGTTAVVEECVNSIRETAAVATLSFKLDWTDLLTVSYVKKVNG